MSTARGLLIGVSLVAALTAAAAVLVLPAMERDLAARARALLDDAAHSGAFSAVEVSFSGQQARLKGRVTDAETKAQLARVISEGLGKTGLNPVLSVSNAVEIDPALARSVARSWIVLTRDPDAKRVAGVLPSQEEKEALLNRLMIVCDGPWLDDQLTIEPGALPAPEWEETLRAIPQLEPAPEPGSPQEGVSIAASTGGGRWQTFPASAADGEVATALRQAAPGQLRLARAMDGLRGWQASVLARRSSADRALAEVTEIARGISSRVLAELNRPAAPPPPAPAPEPENP
jgi:hypothetical protein